MPRYLPARVRIGNERGRVRLTALAGILLGASLLGAGLPGTAVADHGGAPIQSLLSCDRPVEPPRCASVGDNRRHYVFIDPSVPPELAAAIRWVITNVYDTTSLQMREDPKLTPYTDVIAFAADYGSNGAAGWAYCPSDAPQGVNLHFHRWCRHQEIHFNLNPSYAAFFADDASRRHLSCHELGHTLGLLHWGNPPRTDGPTAATCMNADTPNGPTGLHRFDREHVADYYPMPWRLPLSLHLEPRILPAGA